MQKELISVSSILIQAPATSIWHALVTPKIARRYFFGAEIKTDWQPGNPITFVGHFNGNAYEEKGIILSVEDNVRLQYSHWSHFDGLPDLPENYRTWTFDLKENNGTTFLTASEDNIPTEKQKIRSDEFWKEVLEKIKKLVEK